MLAPACATIQACLRQTTYLVQQDAATTPGYANVTCHLLNVSWFPRTWRFYLLPAFATFFLIFFSRPFSSPANASRQLRIPSLRTSMAAGHCLRQHAILLPLLSTPLQTTVYKLVAYAYSGSGSFFARDWTFAGRSFCSWFNAREPASRRQLPFPSPVTAIAPRVSRHHSTAPEAYLFW